MTQLPEKPTKHSATEESSYAPNPVSDETRAKKSERMRELNRKTGRLTALANQMLARRRRSK